MSSALDALKAAFLPSQNKENTGTYTKFFNFWKMAAGETAIVRFLKDSNPDNPRQFIVENLTHSFTINGKKRVVACASMYGEPCAACELSRDYYSQGEKAGETKDRPGPMMALGKKFYRKKEYIGQVHVQSSPIEYERNEGHDQEMPIGLGPQIFKLIQAAFSSGDLDEVPFSEKGGYDFRIVKSEQGGNANYTLSKFAPKQTDLSDDVIANLNLYDLSTLRNRKTDRATMEAMIVADQTGQALVLPNAALAADGGAIPFTSSKAVAAAVSTPVASAKEEAPVESPAPAAQASAEPSNKVNDVLAQIRARAAANKAA
jgi:hypothetical protein